MFCNRNPLGILEREGFLHRPVVVIWSLYVQRRMLGMSMRTWYSYITCFLFVLCFRGEFFEVPVQYGFQSAKDVFESVNYIV